jgi:FAD/FMN-containing dehydrogenase
VRHTDPEIISQYLSDESGLTGSAKAIVRVRDRIDVIDLVKESCLSGERLLPVGCQTATTGAAVPQEDTVVDLRGFSGIESIDTERHLAEVLPGTITWDLKQAVAEAGLYYPPDPTSEKESTIGGNIASNASGARSFKWGMTAHWIEAVEVVTGTGDIHLFQRRKIDKNTAGYRTFLDPVDLFCGAEGTLGIITRAWCRLLPDPGPVVSLILYLRSLEGALKLAVAFREKTAPTPTPRCVEMFDRTALQILATHEQAPVIPETAKAALYLEFDTNLDSIDKVLERTAVRLALFGALVDDTVIAQTASEREWIRTLRHFIPETCNLEARSFHADGGLKVSTEFCVPVHHLPAMMEFVDETADDAGIDRLVRYGHVGNGHPHIFMRGRNPDEVNACKELAHIWYKKAVSLGGTVSGEHGIGKTRRDILKHMYPPDYIAAMRAVKYTFDPHNILAMGNIFPGD